MGSVCPFCGERERRELLEVWPDDRGFLLDCCCEEQEQETYDALGAASRRERRAWLAEAAGIYCRDLIGGTTLDFGLRLGEVPQNVAKQFVRDHHSHCPPPAGWRWGHAAFNGDELIGVAMIGRPVARRLDASRIVEVNRVCVECHPAELGWNACSMLYGAAAKEASRRGFERIITYTMEHEEATALRAVGWEQEATTAGGSWSRRGRKRQDRSPTCRKIRWGRQLRGTCGRPCPTVP